MQIISCRYLLTRALQLIGVNPEGQTPSAQQLSDALYTMNEILDNWNIDGSMLYSQQILTGPLQNGVVQPNGITSYTIGPQAANAAAVSFVTDPRPAYLEVATFSPSGSSNLDIPLRILTDAEWAQIRVKKIQTNIAGYIYMDEQFPVANIYLYPQPTSGSLSLTFWQSFNSNFGLDTGFNLPPGYARAIRIDTACSLAPEFNKPIPADLSAQLVAIKRDLKFTNLRGGSLTYSGDAQGVRSGGGAYDIRSDSVL